MKKFRILLLILALVTAAIVGLFFWLNLEKGVAIRPPLDHNGRPTQVLLELLDVLHVHHDGSLESIVAATQKVWLRPAGKERWEIEDTFAAQRDVVMPLLEKMGFIDEIFPTFLRYRHVLLLGATMQRMRTRLAYLIELWNNGVFFEDIVVLVGQRPRSPEIETDDVIMGKGASELSVKKDWKLSQMPATETDMARLVFEQTELPVGLDKIPVIFVDTPMQKTATGTLRRPNTVDTVLAWLVTNPAPGLCMAVSNQPYCLYQDAVVRGCLHKGFDLETVGSAAMTEKASVATYLDTVARYLYGMHQNLVHSAE